MAWTSDIHDASAGKMLDVLDTLLVAIHATWVEYDSFGSNQKVYRCLDPSNSPPIDFYIHVDDDYADYCKIYMYDSWDIDTHTYAVDTGCKVIFGQSAAYYPVICKKAGGYYFSSQDHRFIYVDKTEWEANYVGMLGQVEGGPLVQNPLLWVASYNYASGYNPLGYYSWSAYYVVANFMQTAMGKGATRASAWGYSSSYSAFETIDGGSWIRPTLVFEYDNKTIQGYLKNVAQYYNRNNLANDDTIIIGGDTWRYVEGTGGTLSASIIKQE